MCEQVQALIGAKKALAFDLTAACSGFVVGLVAGAQFIRTGVYQNVLVIGADALSRYVDWRDRGKFMLSLCLRIFALALFYRYLMSPERTSANGRGCIIGPGVFRVSWLTVLKLVAQIGK